MKIGIVTFHRATNCSAILQAYALVSYPKSLAHETEFFIPSDKRTKYYSESKETFN